MFLTRPNTTRRINRTRQTGVVLIITLIVLVAMTLAAIALMRSVDTTNIIAGNLAFQRSTQLAADAGTESAINNTLPTLVATTNLGSNFCAPGFGYKSFYQPNLDPPNQTWDAFWASMGNCPITLPQDALGNTVSYVIEALCSGNGQVNCMQTPPNPQALVCIGANLGKPNVPCPPIRNKYYRITSRAQGPRNTVSYVQVIIAM